MQLVLTFITIFSEIVCEISFCALTISHSKHSKHEGAPNSNFRSCKMLRSWRAEMQHFVTYFSLSCAEASCLNMIITLSPPPPPGNILATGQTSFSTSVQHITYSDFPAHSACYRSLQYIKYSSGESRGISQASTTLGSAMDVLKSEKLFWPLWLHTWFLLHAAMHSSLSIKVKQPIERPIT